MNCYKFNAFFDKLDSYPHLSYMTNKVLYFHCITTGTYWRTSQITEASLLYQNNFNEWIVQGWKAENEEDEYDILRYFIDTLNSFDTIVGFNSTSFHLPYLESKLKSYDLPLIPKEKHHIDLLKEIKPICKQLHISAKLQDLRLFFDINDQISEIESIAYFSNLYTYEKILNGAFLPVSVKNISQNEYLIECKTDFPFPKDIRINENEFYFIGEKDSIKILLKLQNEYVRLYHANYKDYYYLPEENIILHKSLASTIHKDKKRKATKDNCYTLINFEEKLKNNTAFLSQYLISLFLHYK